MSTYESLPPDQPINDDDPGLRLAVYCESVAQGLSVSYREELTDTFSHQASDGGIGDNVETDIFFSAERLREPDFGIHRGEIIDTEYCIKGGFQKRMLEISDVPTPLQQAMVKDKLIRRKDLEETNLKFSIGIETLFIVNSTGEFTPNYEIQLGAGDKVYVLPKKIVKSMQRDPRGGQDTPVKTDAPQWAHESLAPEDAAALAQLEDEFFRIEFTTDETSVMDTLNRQLAEREAATRPINAFIAQVALFKRAFKRDPHALAQRLVDQAFNFGEAV